MKLLFHILKVPCIINPSALEIISLVGKQNRHIVTEIYLY